MKKILFIISILSILSCSSEEEVEGINPYAYFLELDTPQFKANVNGSYLTYQYGYNRYQMASGSWNPRGDLKDPTRQLIFSLNQEDGNNHFSIFTPTYDSSTPTELDELFAPGIKKIGPGTDGFYIKIINDDSTFSICDVESEYKIEVLKSKEIFDDESVTRKFLVWFLIDKIHSENCSTDTNFEIKDALILAQFLQH